MNCAFGNSRLSSGTRAVCTGDFISNRLDAIPPLFEYNLCEGRSRGDEQVKIELKKGCGHNFQSYGIPAAQTRVQYCVIIHPQIGGATTPVGTKAQFLHKIFKRLGPLRLVKWTASVISTKIQVSPEVWLLLHKPQRHLMIRAKTLETTRWMGNTRRNSLHSN